MLIIVVVVRGPFFVGNGLYDFSDFLLQVRRNKPRAGFFGGDIIFPKFRKKAQSSPRMGIFLLWRKI